MKIGIYGGSFNPPHLGHLTAAVSAAAYLKLDKLLFIPAGIPPHKKLAENTPAEEHRLAMTRLMGEQAALETECKVEVLDMEMRRTGKSYTADTVRELHEQYPDDELWLLMGTDMFLTFQDWYKPEEIVKYTGICAFGRTEKGTEELFTVQREYLAKRFPEARITTMVLPNVVEIYTNAETAKVREVSVGSTRVILRRARVPISENNAAVQSFLEMMNFVSPSFFDEERRRITSDYIRSNGISKKDITKYAAAFPDKAMRTLIESEVIYDVAQ